MNPQTDNTNAQYTDSDPVGLVLDRLRERLCATKPRPNTAERVWACQCAAHDDRYGSLVVTRGFDGRALLKCHQGCSVEAVVDALALRLSDLFVPHQKSELPSRVEDQGSRTAGDVCDIPTDKRQQQTVGTDTDNRSSEKKSRGGEKADGLDQLLERETAGSLVAEPVPLDLDLLPRRGEDVRRAAEAIAHWMGLRLAMFIYTPMPISQRFLARHLGWLLPNGEPDGRRAWNALQTLVKRGVLVRMADLEPLGKKPYGTATFQPPEPLAIELGFAPIALDDTAESSPSVVEPVVPDPVPEVEHELGVDRTHPGVAAAGDDLGVVAAGDKAVLDSFGHWPDPTAPSGDRMFDLELQRGEVVLA